MARSNFAHGTFFTLASLPLILLACGGAPGSGSGGDTADIDEAIHPSTSIAPVCEGPLPDVCEICPDGKEECAHWVRQDGKCETQICAPLTPVAKSTDPTSSAASALADRVTSAAGHRVIQDPILCPEDEKKCIVLRGDLCVTECVKDVDFCVSPRECRTTTAPSTSDDFTAAATHPTRAVGVVSDPIIVRDPLCPVGEKSCIVLDDASTSAADAPECKRTCVPDEVACVTPPRCEPSTTAGNPDDTSSTAAGHGHPVCDPDSPPPHVGGCEWDTKTCVWLCV